MKIELKKFDISKIAPDSVILLIGKRNTGKSFLLRDILSHHKSLPIGMVISPTETANHFFKDFVPNMLIHEEYTANILDRFVNRQKKITEQCTIEKTQYGKTDIDPRAFLILDDSLYDKGWINDKNIRFLFMNGRHIKVFLLITMQYPLGVPPHLRANVDYVFILRENQLKQQERIFQQYAGMFDSFNTFSTVMNACTEDYGVLVINNKTQSNKIEDQVFWYKAGEQRDLKLCSEELWNIQSVEEERKKMGYNKDEDDEEIYNPQTIVSKGNKVKVTVRRKD